MGVSFLSFSLDTYAKRGDQGCVRFEGGGVRLAVRIQVRWKVLGREDATVAIERGEAKCVAVHCESERCHVGL